MLTLKSVGWYQILCVLVLILLNGPQSVNGQKTHHEHIKNLINQNKNQNNLKPYKNIQQILGNSLGQGSSKIDERVYQKQIPDQIVNNQQNADYNDRIKVKFQNSNKQSIKNYKLKFLQNVRLLSDCNIQGCSSCDDYSNICDKCEDNYVLQAGKCYKPDQYPSNCQQAQKTGNPLRYHCTICYTGYALDTSDDSCKQCQVSSCSSCSIGSLDRCDQCSDEYFVTDSNKKCKKCNDNCKVCTSSNDCQECLTGYILYDNKNCEKCAIQNCGYCTYSQSQPLCEYCNQGYLLLKNQCLNVTKSQNGAVSYGDYSLKCPSGCITCSFYYSFHKCYSCEQGYGIDSTTGQCNKCQNSCKNCMNSTCLDCYLGYALTDSTCTKCSVESCTQCDPFNATQCYKCADNYYLHSSGKCYLCNDGCKECDQTGNCSLCSYGYHFFGYENGTTVCQSCISGCGDCEYWAGKCTECLPRFYLTSDQTCSPCQQGCWKCNSSQVCIQCDETKTLVSSSCFDPVQNCKILTKTGVCNECLIGYQLNRTTNKCEYSLSSSLIDSSYYSCPSDSYLYGLKCYKCLTKIDNCLQCRYSYCLKCSAGYYISNNGSQCIKCSINNCQQCKNSQICSKCKSGFYMQSDIVKSYHRSPISLQDQISQYGKCLVCSENCLTCQYRDNICITCKEGYVLISNRNCITKNRFDFQIKIDADFSTFASRVDDLKAQFIYLIQDNQNVSLSLRKKFIHFTALSQGSVNVAGYVSATTPENLQKTYDNFNTLSSGGQLNNGFPIISSKLSNYQTASTVDNSSSQGNIIVDPPIEDTNILPIVIGIAVGVVVLIVVIVVLVYCCCCKKKKEEMREMSEDKKSSSTGQQRSEKDKNEKQCNPDSHNYFGISKGQKQQNWVSPQYYL